MRTFIRLPALVFIAALAACSGNTNPPAASNGSNLPPANTSIAVPAGVTATSGYRVSVFAAPPSGSTKPDSVIQDGNYVFVGFGDTVNPDGSANPPGKSSTEIAEYNLVGNLVKTFSVPGHNDGLMAYDANTVWAMSNEDANPVLTVISLSSGSETTYTAQPSLLSGPSPQVLPHGGGLDDMQLIAGSVYVSGSNPSAPTGGTCPANSSTPGCPNGISSGTAVYVLTFSSGAATFNLTPVVSSGATATDIATNASGTLNMTDPDSESIAADGSTLVLDSQQDSTLIFIANLSSATPTLSYLPLAGGIQVDDTRYAPGKPAFLVMTDTPANLIYRIDGSFSTGTAFSAGVPTSGAGAVYALGLTSGSLTPIVSGLNSPHGLAFVTTH